jgi:hypothetical protein
MLFLSLPEECCWQVDQNNFQMSHPVVLHNINHFFQSITTFLLIIIIVIIICLHVSAHELSLSDAQYKI